MRKKLNGSALVVVGAIALLFTSSFYTKPSFAVDLGAPVTQEQFRLWTNWAKKSVQILDRREKDLDKRERKLNQQAQAANANANANANGGEVNLQNLGGTSQASLGGGGQGGGGLPKMETYFDLNLLSQPGTTEGFEFDTFHSFIFFTLNPSPDLSFSFNLLGPGTLPVYYELDYHASDTVTVRAGKIWIPFDDLSQLSPHNIFGGRDGLAQFMPSLNGSLLFLPSVWTELGVGVRYLAMNTPDLQLQTDLTITNGFGDGGTDPATGGDYPSFGYTQPPNSAFQGTANSNVNHRDKAIDARVHALFGNIFGVGASYYTSQWTPDTGANAGAGPLFLSMFGFDAQLQLGQGMELRTGLCSQSIMTSDTVSSTGTAISGTAKRAGFYTEFGVPINSKWKVLARGGTLQFDNRVAGLVTDVLGGEVLYNPGTLQFSLEHSRSVSQATAANDFTSFTDLRMIMLF